MNSKIDSVYYRLSRAVNNNSKTVVLTVEDVKALIEGGYLKDHLTNNPDNTKNRSFTIIKSLYKAGLSKSIGHSFTLKHSGNLTEYDIQDQFKYLCKYKYKAIENKYSVNTHLLTKDSLYEPNELADEIISYCDLKLVKRNMLGYYNHKRVDKKGDSTSLTLYIPNEYEGNEFSLCEKIEQSLMDKGAICELNYIHGKLPRIKVYYYGKEMAK